jgi:chitin disaccharide deacetylase
MKRSNETVNEAASGSRSFIINADDFGMDPAVDSAILELAASGVVTATSAMVLSPNWAQAGMTLCNAPIDCGLHLDFTSPFAARIGFGQNLPVLMAKAFSRQLRRQPVRDAVHRQFDLFETAMGRAPDFVDGHQHVHQFPVIRIELIRALSERYNLNAKTISVRSCVARRWRGLKAAIVAGTGANSFAALAKAGGHAVNSDFAGVYGFDPKTDLHALWSGWIASLQGCAPLVMCHVADNAKESSPDPIRPARLTEYAWLKSATFRSLIAELGVIPVRWPKRQNSG